MPQRPSSSSHLHKWVKKGKEGWISYSTSPLVSTPLLWCLPPRRRISPTAEELHGSAGQGLGFSWGPWGHGTDWMEASSENMKPSICQFSSLFYYVNETKDRHLLMATFPAGEGKKKLDQRQFSRKMARTWWVWHLPAECHNYSQPQQQSPAPKGRGLCK